MFSPIAVLLAGGRNPTSPGLEGDLKPLNEGPVTPGMSQNGWGWGVRWGKTDLSSQGKPFKA